ncbi:MAG: CoA-acylating methylmalonate-semialdehyde dehydrogenase [Armatimonadetes bacterium]|nr:CoA-acylating methylmalonate-semialdehyde dehydrogenase [Armatimonadota bacterium]
MQMIDTIRTLTNFIGGAWRPSVSGHFEDVPNPATGAVIACVPFSTGDEVDAAVQAAAHAYPAWRDRPVVERARVMFSYRELLERHFEELATIVTKENGKTIDDARGEVRRGIEVVEFACGMPTLMMGSVLEDVSRGIDSEFTRYPLGVVAGICPFNFPVMIPLWMMPIAIAAGNTFVLKPSERTPQGGARLAELLHDAGLPAGVINVVNGGKDVVDGLLEHADVKAVSFVGSQPVAAYVYKTAAAHGKRVQALGGAKNHIIVMPDADMDKTVAGIMSSAFGAAGERCLAGSVVLAVGDVADELVNRLVAAANDVIVGDGLDSATAMGPVIRPSHRERIEGYVEKGKQEGARVLCGGSRPGGGGYFLKPTIFDGVTPEMTIAKEEIFGPVLGVIRTKTLDDAIAIANRSRFGNASSIFTRSGPAARQYRRQIEAGMIGINVGVAAPMAFFPFSGWKNSFYGDLHATGRDGVEFYTEKKVITSRWA